MFHACKEQGYTISGNIPDAEGMEIVLKARNVDSAIVINSCIVKRKKFKMTGVVEYPQYCELYIGDNGPLLMFVENSKITLSIDVQQIHKSKVTGSIENDLFAAYNDKMDELGSDSSTRPQRIEYMKQFAAEHPNRIVTAFIVNNYLSYYLQSEELESIVDGFDSVNSNSSWVMSIIEKIGVAKRIEIGQPFVDLTMSDPDGNMISLSDYAGKGDFLLIDFWASWCPPCRVANPDLVKLYDKYKDRGFEIVGVAFEMDKDEWTKAIEADEMTWPNMSSLTYWQCTGAKLYLVNLIPHTVLLDRDGIIIARGLKPDGIDKKLEELLDNNE